MEPISRAHLKMIRYFLHVTDLPDSRLTKKVLLHDINFSNYGSNDCWASEVSNILNTNELGQYFTSPGNTKMIITSLKASLLNSDKQSFIENCLSFPKLRTYIKITNFNEENIYLYKPLSFSQKSYLAKFKLGVLPIRIETERFCYPILPEKDRVCLQCNSGVTENEIHFILYCSKHNEIRTNFFNYVELPTNIQTDTDIIKFFISSPSLVKKFSQLIIDCYNNREII